MDEQSTEGKEKEEVTQPVTNAGTGKKKRLVMAVGDLHGDYFRLLRHLRDLDLLLPDTLAWNPDKDNVDVVLIGDYVDWRGESLETPTDQSPIDSACGARKIIELIMLLERELQLLRQANPEFGSHFYPLLGNHDDMMLDAMQVFDFLSINELQEQLNKAKSFQGIKRQLSDAGYSGSQIERVLRFVNWYIQGGEVTVRGFGGMQAWKDAMEGQVGSFLRDRLYLAVIVNRILFAHTVPDSSKFWRPIEEIVCLPQSEYDEAKEAFMWSRKVWGFDYNTGFHTSPFEERELESMLTKLGCDRAVIGHTPISRGTEHIVSYGGRIVNIDVHGAPGSKAFIEEYVVKPELSNLAFLRSERLRDII